MAYLADTNVVTRRVLPADPLYPTITAAIQVLRQQGETIYITPQNLIEFQALATRPAEANGLGMPPTQASAEARAITAIFPLLPEISAIYHEWRTLVDTYAIIGRQVYDARLVAVMRAYGLTHILTTNPTHFRRFADITVVEPRDLISPMP